MVPPPRSRWRALAGLLLALTAATAANACRQEGGPSPEPATLLEVSFLTPRYLSEAIDKLLGPLPKPVRILSLTAVNRVVVLQVQDVQDPKAVTEYRYHNDQSVSGPTPVELRGPGKLVDNLFRADSIDLHMAEKVLERVRSEYSEDVRKLVVTRNLPTSLDIQFRVFLQTREGDRVVVADKNGRLLGPLTQAPTPTNSSSPSGSPP